MVIVIVGPTGVGKTKLSIELAKNINGEIINADSTQVYKGLDIATAKIKDLEKQGIPHHLFDIKTIDYDYTVYDYQQDARKKIDEILKRGKTPILVGGTGFYIKACLYNYSFNKTVTNNNYDGIETDELYSKLLEIDVSTTIHKNNRKRIIRALNYYYDTNKSITSKEKSNELLYDTIFIGLKTDREKLYEIINKRVDKMLEDGLIEEALKLYKSNIRTKAVLTPIGYKELFLYFDNKITKEEAIEKIKQNSRRYAKRQDTWNKNQFNVNYIEVDFDNFNNTVNEALKLIK